MKNGMFFERRSPEPAEKCQEVGDRLPIIGISQPTILRYFETFNSGEFQAIADLFALDGTLYPPFEPAIVGREAIATYLATEAQGMALAPQAETCQILETGDTQVKVTGKVQTKAFGVNVRWCFVLSPQAEILSARIKLLAGLEDLLSLKK